MLPPQLHGPLGHASCRCVRRPIIGGPKCGGISATYSGRERKFPRRCFTPPQETCVSWPHMWRIKLSAGTKFSPKAENLVSCRQLMFLVSFRTLETSATLRVAAAHYAARHCVAKGGGKSHWRRLIRGGLAAGVCGFRRSAAAEPQPYGCICRPFGRLQILDLPPPPPHISGGMYLVGRIAATKCCRH
jgi:hypothetical protein